MTGWFSHFASSAPISEEGRGQLGLWECLFLGKTKGQRRRINYKHDCRCCYLNHLVYQRTSQSPPSVTSGLYFDAGALFLALLLRPSSTSCTIHPRLLSNPLPLQVQLGHQCAIDIYRLSIISRTPVHFNHHRHCE
ncbi:hypothetical protein CPB84DRAFT_1790759 [Gymnopilus junonius]|uniref:Uncharacterized protein n=1 Tax=Gymnopilus junonius TaxID=109634 RepID=A0A9P5THU9_GYMJU|nr:hypothetical protein CPB84DRAFT_1790759 [Gymnopilus junonius]